MDGLFAHAQKDSKLKWSIHPDKSFGDGISVHFTFSGHHNDRTALMMVENALRTNNISWLIRSGTQWTFDPTSFTRWSSSLQGVKYTGVLISRFAEFSAPVNVSPVVQRVVTTVKPPEVFISGSGPVYNSVMEPYDVKSTDVDFSVYSEDFSIDNSSKIFLSHKGSDKHVVERFFDVLKLLGFSPWLDIHDMPAGTELHRGIRQGFKDSCAAVFFITPNFKDERYLKQEINYAMEEKTEKDNRFSIVTLVFTDEHGHKGEVPELLKSYVWKEPKTEFEALSEIIRALPVTVGPVNWRVGI